MSVATHSVETHLKGLSDLENGRIRFDLYGSSYTQLQDLAQAITDAVVSASGFKALPIFDFEMFEDDTQLYHLVHDFSVWNNTTRS
jgi:hypothetical protein